MRLLAAIVAGCAFMAVALSARADVTLVMFRHGEKPAAGLGQLSCQGLNRSLALPSVLLNTYGKPAAIFAPNPGIAKDDDGVAYNYLRPLATVEPTAIRAGLPVDTRWGWRDIAHLQDELLSPAHEGQVLYVAWEHHLLESLARAILARRGADPDVVKHWDGADFDSIYVITLPTAGGASLRVRQEGLDHLPQTCPDR